MTIQALRQMPRSEKLKLLEALWEDLSCPDSEFQSPAWHAEELAVTERRLAEGKEQIVDWEAAKQEFRSSSK
ncbi:MAG: addiction module protein [Limisphaerales bacterium]